MKAHLPFPATQWTRLEQEGGTPEGREWFCEEYRPAVMAYLCTRFSHHEAEDLCQEFFSSIVIGRDIPGRADRQKGSLRAYLSKALDNYLANHFRRQKAKKRGGGIPPVPLAAHPSTTPIYADARATPPDVAFDKAWATNLFERAIAAAEVDWTGRNKQRLFDALRPLLDGSGPVRPHAEIAAELNIKTKDVTYALSKLRQLVAKYLYEAVQATVSGEGQMEGEWMAIKRALEDR